MIDPADLRRHVIRPTLEKLGLYSASAANILLGTAIVEPTIGNATHLVQKGGGPALGIYQIEPATARDNWVNYLCYRDELKAKVTRLMVHRPGPPPDDEMVWNLAYATAMARIKYLRDPEPLPAADDLEGMGQYWLRVYNGGGKGTVEHWLSKVEPHRAVLGGGE